MDTHGNNTNFEYDRERNMKIEKINYNDLYILSNETDEIPNNMIDNFFKILPKTEMTSLTSLTKINRKLYNGIYDKFALNYDDIKDTEKMIEVNNMINYMDKNDIKYENIDNSLIIYNVFVYFFSINDSSPKKRYISSTPKKHFVKKKFGENKYIEHSKEHDLKSIIQFKDYIIFSTNIKENEFKHYDMFSKNRKEDDSSYQEQHFFIKDEDINSEGYFSPKDDKYSYEETNSLMICFLKKPKQLSNMQLLEIINSSLNTY